jgi:hypothetical protein
MSDHAPDCQASPIFVAAWIVAGAIGDGIDIWAAGDVISYHGPLESRERWHHTMESCKTPLRVYLERECWPGGKR